jgi:hypothetical protein
MLGDVHLVVTSPDGTVNVVEPDYVQRTNLDGYGMSVLYQISSRAVGVVKPGDQLTAVVRDQDANDGSKTVTCSASQTKKKTSASITCR